MSDKMREAIANIETALNFSADAIENLTDEEISILRAGQDAVIYMQSQQPESEPAAAIEAAAQWVEARRDAYIEEHGSYDPDTGATEFPGDGEEYVGELGDIAEGIRSLRPQPSAQVPDGWRTRKIEEGDRVGFIVGTPRVAGVRANTSVWLDDEDPAHRLLAVMLAAPSIAEKDHE